MQRICFILTDFGQQDNYVGVMADTDVILVKLHNSADYCRSNINE